MKKKNNDVTESMKDLIKLLLKQMSADDIYVMYKDFGMGNVCNYIESKYLSNDTEKSNKYIGLGHIKRNR